MRLICPNCDARYEVDAAMIPPEGRDVQCSACGQVWFQPPGPAVEDLDAEAALPAAPVDALPDELPAEPDPRPEPDPDPQVLRRHSLDESMLAVLREEAEREARARADEAARSFGRGVEIQPDLGLPEAEPAAQLRIRRRSTEAPPAEPGEEDLAQHRTPPSGRNARRELLPDIDQINSTLDAEPGNRSGATGLPPLDRPELRRNGFRSGFLLMLVLAGLAWAAYVQAPRLIQSMPQAEPALTTYVTMVDRARLGLDGLVQRLLGATGG